MSVAPTLTALEQRNRELERELAETRRRLRSLEANRIEFGPAEPGSTPLFLHAAHVARDAESNPPLSRDTADWREQESALREARYLLEQAEAIAEVGCWAKPVGSDALLWTHETYRIAGIPDQRPITASWFYATIVHPDDRGAVEREIARSAAERTTYQLEYRIVRLDGEVRWVHARAILECDAAGTPKRIIGTIQDITARREVNAALHASEERYRLILETTSEGVWLGDANHRTTFVNQRLADLLGYRREEMIGQSGGAFLTEEGLAISRTMFERRASRQGGQSYENAYRRKDGTTCWCLAKTNEIVDANGAFVGLVGILTDITERRQSEEMRNRLASIVESSGESIIGTRLDGTITSWNRAAETLFGYAADEILGRPSSILVRAPVAPDEVTLLARIAAGDRVEHETAALRKDGSAVPVSLVISPIHGSLGDLVGASMIARDLTERKEHEAALKRTENELRHSQKMEAIGSLAGGIAHDFNNILSVILGYTKLLMTDLDADHPMREDLQEIHTAATRAANLTRQLLAFGRRQNREPRVLDLDRVVSGIQKMLLHILGEDIVLSISSAPTLGKVDADVGQIEQVLMNLVVNARDAMPGGGHLTIEITNLLRQECLSEHHSTPPGDYVLLRVSDTGAGMDRATRERIFEPFFTTKGEGKGTGLGLSTVYGIVRQNGGHIDVASEPGHGTTFRVYLPQTQLAVEEPVAGPMVGPVRGGTETVLLVEDEDQVRAVMRAILRERGYQILEAQNGGEALLISETFAGAIDLLVTDVVMPRMSGGTLAERLVLQRPAMRVLYVSGYPRDAVHHHTLGNAGHAFLSKPATPDALSSKVREILDDGARRSRSPQNSSSANSG